MSARANYALVYVGAHLGSDRNALSLDWADFVGDQTQSFEFTVPTADAFDAYLGIQAYDVGEFGHEIYVNDDPLGGFDIPPNDGWQYWVDALAEVTLADGENTFRIARDRTTDDNFAVGNVTIHWKEPVGQ